MGTFNKRKFAVVVYCDGCKSKGKVVHEHYFKVGIQSLQALKYLNDYRSSGLAQDLFPDAPSQAREWLIQLSRGNDWCPICHENSIGWDTFEEVM